MKHVIPNLLAGPTEFFIKERYDYHVMAWKWNSYMQQFMHCNDGLAEKFLRSIWK